MNKIFKYLLIGIGVGSIFFASCKADLIGTSTRQTYTIKNHSGYTETLTGNYCFQKTTTSYEVYYTTGNNTQNGMLTWSLYCFNSGTTISITTTSTSNITIGKYDLNSIVDYGIEIGTGQCNNNCPTIDQNYCTENNLCPSCPSCPSCDEPYTSLECQTEYNLIPISSVTSAYCESNFNLIDPATCPINEGTGAINWSSLFINNTQYAGNDEIQILFPDYLAWNIVFNTGVTYVEVEGYNADTDYIEDVIAKTQMTPTNEDVSILVNGLQVYIPYIFISMIIIFALILINKFFR